ncbi:hypothetical protein RDABS01_034302 [Bienertia sinuspersici]
MKYIRSRSLKRLFSIGRRNSTSITEDSGISEEDSPEICHFSKLEFVDSHLFSKKPTFKCFSFEELFVATNGFSSGNMVGKGGYSEVYKGELKNGEKVAVKKLTKASNEEKREREFLTEIGTIGHVYHPNVSSLLGCCIDHDQSIAPMEWELRHKIAIGTAKGLHYLHKGCQRRIIHRDIKATNILLNEDFEPQISDFGLAKWLPTQWSHHSIAPIEGTAKPFLKRGEIERLVDPRLEDAFDEIQIRRLAFAASLCIRSSTNWRPNMSEVLEMMLGGEVDEKRWEMPDKETQDQEEYMDFEDLEYECDSSFSTSIHDSISTGSS